VDKTRDPCRHNFLLEMKFSQKYAKGTGHPSICPYTSIGVSGGAKLSFGDTFFEGRRRSLQLARFGHLEGAHELERKIRYRRTTHSSRSYDVYANASVQLNIHSHAFF
jgi:hypothetical protein